MSIYDNKNAPEDLDPQISIGQGGERLDAGDDLVMESILDNINTTPLGQVLKKIASLPEIRKQKILRVRQQLNDGQYDVNKNLDIALDKVLEDLIT